VALIKIAPNKWSIRVSVRVPGRDYPLQKRETFAGTKTDAAARQAEIIKGLREGSSLTVSPNIRTFSDILSLFSEKRNKTAAPDLSRIRQLAADLGHIPVEQFPDRFENYLKLFRATPTKKTGKPPSNAAYNRILEMVRAAFNLMVALQVVEKNLITKARFPKAEEKPRDRYLTDTERLRLLNVIQRFRPHILPFVRYSLAVPCRKSELTAARREQYDPFTNTVYIPDSKAGIPITKPVPPDMTDYFRSIPTDCPYLFYRKDEAGYHPLGDFRKAWAFCLRRAGLQNVRIHDLRHVAASDLYASGVSEREIMDVAGWKTPMLSTYRHRDSLKSAQRINSMFETPAAAAQSAAL